MAKKNRELTTRRMPSGAQQYVRPTETGSRDSAATRMRTINNVARRSDMDANLGLSSAMSNAMIDESRLARIGDSNDRQVRDEDQANRRGAKKFAGGGMVRGTRPVQVSGKNFSGNF